MWVIAKNALRERMRRKELYIVVAVGILILLLCSSGTATITMNGEPITSFDNMIVGILYLALAVYIVANGRTDYLVRMLPSYLIVCIAVATASLFTSVLSIVFPAAVTGILGILFALGGILHGILDLYKNVAGGVAGTLLKGLLFVLPDMNGIQQQARRLMAQESVDVHLILTGLLAIYVLSVGIMVLRRREA